MTPYEIMLSESQERMLLVATRGREAEIRDIFAKWELDAVEIGAVTADGVLRVRSHGRIVAEVPVKALADEAPVYEKPTARPAWQDALEAFDPLSLPVSLEPEAALLALLASPGIASKEWVYRQYDQQVGTNTLVLPGSDAGVLRIKGTRKAVALTTDCNARFVHLNPRLGAAMAVAEAAPTHHPAPSRGSQTGRGRGCAQRLGDRRSAARPHRLLELRLSRAPRDPVAVQGSGGGYRGGLPRAGNPGGRRQCLLLQ